ncbi:MAG: hypothetical protein CMO44_16720, partial [Verrucomicrobiales bacterium]|nr:hypothetical protein [Verrucomicrobiales bacterium]
MVLRNVAKTFSLEQQRQEINLLAADLHALSIGSETDPIFTASAASAVTTQNISDWNSAYQFTSTFQESDPIFSSSPAYSVTHLRIANWDSAFLWGNHASVGYLLKSTIAISDNQPGNPSNGELWWKSDSGVLKVYYEDGDTNQWVDASPTSASATSAKVLTADVPPTNPVNGDLWWKSDSGTLKVYFSDSDSNQWVDASPAGGITGGGGGGGASVTTSDTAPTSPSDGDLWWKSDTGYLKIYFDDGNTSQWVDASPVGGGGSPSILYADVSSFPAVSNSESKFAYADDTGVMYYSNGVSWTSQRLVTTNSTTSSDFATLLGNTQLTYNINVLDYSTGTVAENAARKIIRLEDSSGTTDQIVLVAGTGLAISDSGDEIQFDLTADIANSTYSISAESAAGNADSILRLTDNAGTTDEITFAGADGLLVERTDANTLTFRAPSGASGGSYTTEDAQDAAALLFSNGTHTGINFTYNDSNNSIDAVVTGGGGGGGTTYDLLGSNTTSNNAILTLRDAAN